MALSPKSENKSLSKKYSPEMDIHNIDGIASKILWILDENLGDKLSSKIHKKIPLLLTS
jgi:hypothetical protein